MPWTRRPRDRTRPRFRPGGRGVEPAPAFAPGGRLPGGGPGPPPGGRRREIETAVHGRTARWQGGRIMAGGDSRDGRFLLARPEARIGRGGLGQVREEMD